LAAAKSKEKSPGKLKQIAQDVLDHHNLENWDIELIVTTENDMVKIEAKTTYDTVLMGLASRDEMKVSVNAGAPIAATTPIKLALVLDTTDSMAGANMNALKSATEELIEELEDIDAPVAASVVPFGQYVNVGTHRKGANWLDVAKDGTSETKEVCRDEVITITPRICTDTGRVLTRDDVRDGVVVGQISYNEQSCTQGEWQDTGVDICEMKTTSYEWRGCVGSRDTPYNTQADFGATRIKGVMNRSCGTPLQELTTDLDDIEDVVEDLTTNGDTYLPSGLIWGWRTLTQAEPLTSPSGLPTTGETRLTAPSRVMLVMTDGGNTRSHGGQEDHHHDWSNVDNANTRSSAICEAAKEDGVVIFTVGYRMSDARAESRTLLQNCASLPSFYFSADNAAELKNAFTEIAGQLDVARLAW